MSIIVANAHRGIEVVYVGRATSRHKLKTPHTDGSCLGNPFYAAPKADNIKQYRKWLFDQIRIHGPVRDLMYRLAKIDTVLLVCFCAPSECHADVIKACLEWIKLKPVKTVARVLDPSHVHDPVLVGYLENPKYPYSYLVYTCTKCDCFAGQHKDILLTGPMLWCYPDGQLKQAPRHFWCSVCHEPVYRSRGGYSCKFGHAGTQEAME